MNKFFLALAIILGVGAFVACAKAKSGEDVIVLDPQAFVKQAQQDSTAYILDVRKPSEFAEGFIPGAVLLDYLNSSAFEQGVAQLDKNRTYYVYCRSGRRSNAAASQMQRQGFKVYDMKGGFMAYKALGLPIATE